MNIFVVIVLGVNRASVDKVYNQYQDYDACKKYFENHEFLRVKNYPLFVR